MKNNILCLYTAEFPYGKGEQFLETEIKYLAQHFKHIYIFPRRIGVDKRELPVNTEVLIIPKTENYTTPKGIKYISWWSVYYFFETLKFTSLKIGIGTTLMKAFQNEKLFHYLKDKKVLNAIHYSYWFTEWGTELAILKSKKKIKRFISRAHGYDLYTERNKQNYIPYRKFQLKHIDKLYLIAKQGLNYISKKHPEYKTKYKVAYLGTEDYGLGVKPDKTVIPTIVSCSFIVPVKRLNLIVEALKYINFPVKWIHIGDGQEKEQIKKQAKDLPENIKFVLKGYLSNKKVMSFYQETPIHAFINVSVSEGLPVSIMEAISFGIPVIATNVGGVSEIVNEKTGVLIPKNIKPKELSSVISKVIIDNAIWDRKIIRQFWKDNFFAQKNYLDFISEIKNTL